MKRKHKKSTCAFKKHLLQVLPPAHTKPLSGLIVFCIYLLFKISHVLQLIQHGGSFSIDLQDAYLHIPIVKHHHPFLQFVWSNMPYQWKVLPFVLATAHRIFTALTKPILFLWHHKSLHIVIYLDDILVLV